MRQSLSQVLPESGGLSPSPAEAGPVVERIAGWSARHKKTAVFGWLALVAVLFALVGTFYYIRIVKLMYFDEPQDAGRIVAKLDVSVLLSANGLAVLVLGILPQPLMQLCFYAIKGL